MKRFILLLLSVLLVNFTTPVSRSATDAPRFVSLEGRFSILLPEQYKQQTRLTVPTPSGGASGKLFEWQIKKQTFGIGYADAVQPITGADAIKQLFNSLTDEFRNLAARVNGNPGVVKDITLANHPGIEQRADINKGALIQRTYLVSRRIYQTIVVVSDSKRDESTAIGVLDTFKLLSDAEITEEALRTAPGPFPQTPETPRAGSDASDEGLRGPVKSVRSENQYTSKTRFGPQSWLTTYNEKGNKVRTESFDFKNNLDRITVYGYLDGNRVSASKFVPREYGPAIGTGGGIGPVRSNRKKDPRYDFRFEFKYDEKRRLIEETEYYSNADFSRRTVSRYEGNQKETLIYLDSQSWTQRNLDILDDKGNLVERTVFAPDSQVRSSYSFTYEFDSNGNWTKRTVSWKVADERIRRFSPETVVRTITYY